MNKIKSIIRNSTVLLGFATIPVLSSSCSQTKEQKYEALKKEINEFNEIPKYKTNIDSFNRIVTSFTQLNNKLKDKITLTTETSAKVNEIKKAINELNQQIGAFESLKHKINESIDNYEDVSNLYSGTLSKLKELNNKIESTDKQLLIL
ncbi:hypothetical protein [Mycoplasmopsis caviae]|uniref:Lipoprotein n=1 Tax=Mycoplasmopsis caviae TaxID=55603 RepID=A0A3P8KLE9_9BACT|nr:hypothetical protein [Mycoplasmopsis caviae]VDR41528.1 Uncharacterised protein [Mycoplasmopsis caviae]